MMPIHTCNTLVSSPCGGVAVGRNPSVDVVVTDYGIVVLSPETIDYLNGLAENWRTYPNKPRSKRGKLIKSEIDKTISTVMHVAKIGFATGREVEYF